MKELKKHTKKAKAIIASYERAKEKECCILRDCYNTFSLEKERAYQRIVNRLNFNYATFYIISFCSMHFSCGYITTDNKLIYDTYKNTYIIDLND